MKFRRVKATNGWQWIISGFYQFRSTPLGWMVLCFTLLMIALTLSMLPLLGQFIFTLLSPVFLAGMMLGCRDMEQGKKLQMSHLFAGFKKNAASLITIGGVYLVGQVLIVGVIMMIGGTAMTDMLLYGTRVDESELMGVMDSMLTAAIIALALSIPLMMAAWFSPLLVVFHDMPALLAMKRSFYACLRNIFPFQLYGITLIILVVLASLPYGLGLIVLIPVIFTSIYASYKDVFLAESIIIKDEQPDPHPQEAVWTEEEDQPAKSDEAEMVTCAHCGKQIPKTEAVHDEEAVFCSEEHRDQYQSSTENNDNK
jgi:hypothetical protein